MKTLEYIFTFFPIFEFSLMDEKSPTKTELFSFTELSIIEFFESPTLFFFVLS